MTLEEYEKYDVGFNKSMFLTKVNNMFIKYFTNIMLDKLDEVNHFVSDEVYQNGLNIINNAKKNGHRQMYDELNIKETTITDYIVHDDVYIIKVYLQSRYLNYIISLDDGNYVSGNNQSRIQVNYNLVLEKRRNALNQGVVRKCPSCGAPISVNTSGKCEYCDSIYNQEDYDWVITSLEKA